MASIGRILVRTVVEFRNDRCPQMAAAIAYHTLFSVVPVVAILVAVFGWTLRDPAVEERVIQQVLDALPLRSGMVVDAISGVRRASEPLSIAGLLLLAWVSFGMFGTIRDSLNAAWGVKQSRSYLRAKLIDLASMTAVAALLAISIAGTGVLHAARARSAERYAGGPDFDLAWNAAAIAFPALITFVAFLFVYRYFPTVEHRFRDVWVGALAGALLFEAAKHAFTFYVSHVSRFEMVYGALGTVMLFLMWIYLSASVLLFGAEFARVIGEMKRSRR